MTSLTNKKQSSSKYGFLPILTGFGVLINASPSFAAASNLNEVVDTFAQQTINVPALLSLCAYILGIVVLIAAALKLKAHGENPGNTPISHGLVRLIVGGGLMALPVVGKIVQESTGIGGTNTVTYVRPNVSWTAQ